MYLKVQIVIHIYTFLDLVIKLHNKYANLVKKS